MNGNALCCVLCRFIERDANGKRIYTRLSPPEYKAKYFNNPKYAGEHVCAALLLWTSIQYRKAVLKHSINA